MDSVRKSKLNKKYFDEIASGAKTVEGRPARWLIDPITNKQLVIGDTIDWTCRETGKTIKTIVLNIKAYESFESMYDEHGEQLLPGISNRDAAADVYKEWYEKEMENGSMFIAITLKLIIK
jgi:ASC-1-like (ASCH) protein